MIELEEIEKTFFTEGVQTPVLHDINLTIGSGEYLAIMGPSGTGKSTLMNILGFLDRPTEGQYLFDGNDVTSFGDGELSVLRNRRIGFVFQLFHLLDRLTVVENVMLPLLYTEPYPAHAKEFAYRLLASVGLSERLHFKPNTLSGGEQQRVAIARALINEPSLVLADEPTGNLDSSASGEILDIFDELHEQGRSIVLVTHDPNVARRCKRVINVLDGRITSDTITV